MLMLPLTLRRALSPYGHAEDIDVHNLKTALNHLGYYTPDSFAGIEEMREPALFEALQAFQTDHELAQSPHLTPHDPTVRAVNKALREQNMQGRYIWRSVGDSKVRDAHAAREGQIFTWGFPPQGGHPGEDFNCRCWAEVVDNPKKKKYGPPDCREEQQSYNNSLEKFKELDSRLKQLEKEIQALEQKKAKLLEKIANQLAKAGLGIWLIDVPINYLESHLVNIMRKFTNSKVQKSLMDQLAEYFDQFTTANKQLTFKQDQKAIVEALLKKTETEVLDALQKLNLCLIGVK